MDFGVVLQTNPPASGVIAMMQRAEEAGFSYGWTWDSHVLWQEPFVIYSRILSATSAMTVGPMVTNPGTRDWSVIASLFATLNDMYGNRTVCGIGRGDSARRVIGQPPLTLATLSDASGTTGTGSFDAASGTLVFSTERSTVVAEGGRRRDARTPASAREPAAAGAGRRDGKSVLDLPDLDAPKRDSDELVN